MSPSPEADPDAPAESSPFIADAGADEPPKPKPRLRRGGARANGDAPPAAEPAPAEPPATPQVRRQRTTRGERPPKTSPAPGRRVSLAGLLGSLYGGAGQMLSLTGRPEFVPTARVLQWNAPVGGRALDDAIAGTALDRVLQPLAKSGDKLERVGEAVGLPVMIYALTTRPELWPVLEPMARTMFYANLRAMAPVIKEQKKREQEMSKVIAELAGDGLIGANEDGTLPDADGLFRSLFEPPITQPPAPDDQPPADA